MALFGALVFLVNLALNSALNNGLAMVRFFP